jgi:hypothetical protein
MLKQILLLPILVFSVACGKEFHGFQQTDLSLNANDVAPLASQPIENTDNGVVIPFEPAVEQSEVVKWTPFSWDGKHKDSMKWREFALNHINQYGKNLVSVVPSDIASFCPKYKSLNLNDKKMFWIALLSSMARFESNYKPEMSFEEDFSDTSGDNVISRGLLQISGESARNYGCKMNSDNDLHKPETNLRCGVMILDRWIGRDKVISSKSSSGSWRGGARYWAVLRSTRSMFRTIQSMTKSSKVCQ